MNWKESFFEQFNKEESFLILVKKNEEQIPLVLVPLSEIKEEENHGPDQTR